MKKIILLTAICLPLATGSALAQNYGGGRGTEADPYRISTRAHLEELATMVNGGTAYDGYHFRLTADLTGTVTVIGKSATFPFSGAFDGDGHRVDLNININSSEYVNVYAGLFGYLSGATVKNTGVGGVVIYSSAPKSYYDNYAGGICGYANSATIINCYNTGNISASYAGGICGYASSATIINCYNTGNISAASASSSYSSSAGGICGYAKEETTISNCYNTGNISAAGNISADEHVFSRAGGICGYADYTTISNCYNTGNISASSSSSSAGGICGYANYDITIINCYNTGNISSSSTGGICGYAYYKTTIINCYNTGNISASSYAGGICGYGIATSHNCFAANATITASRGSEYAGRIANGTVSHCYALSSMKVNGLVKSSMKSDSEDGADAEMSEFKDMSWLTSTLGWDFNDVWMMSENGGLPALRSSGPVGNMSPELPEAAVLYPSPAVGEVHIRSARPVSRVEIYSMSGACVLTADNACETVDIRPLPAGIYAVRIYTSSAPPQTQKLIVRR
jgi:hypothetical protein